MGCIHVAQGVPGIERILSLTPAQECLDAAEVGVLSAEAVIWTQVGEEVSK
jgi:hypothetical protein